MGNLNTKMTALADEIRELSGTNTTKSIDAMTTDVGAANTEISEQMELIAQISTALEGKAAGSSSEDVTEETTAYTTKIGELETAVAALESELEGKASGGSDNRSFETCTVRIICSTTDIYGYLYTKVVDRDISMGCFTNEGSKSTLDVTINDVLCGSFIAITTGIPIGFLSVNISGDATYEVIRMTSSVDPVVAITVPVASGSYSEVTIIDND